ncbi:YIP1 family protein [bacterium]|nr:MAG: YIP1 family protein [bacterium]
MIKCTVCLAENDDFAITCPSCKAFLQDRVPNLDLFDMGWRVLESPRKAFRTITLADHKNYALLLFTLFGISLSFTGFWYFRLGTQFASLLDLMPAAVGVGIVLGLVASVLMTAVYYAFAKLLGGASGFRGSLGVLGYCLMPLALTLFIVLPIELLTFGMFLFTSNPHPYAIKPLSYTLLVGFNVVVSLWSIVLAVLGTQVGHRISLMRSIVVVLATLGVFFGGMFLVAHQLHLTDRV